VKKQVDIITLPQTATICDFPLDVHLLRWEIVWRNAPRIWRDFGSALPFQTRLTQTKPVLPLSDEFGSQVKDKGRRQCCHNKHKNFHIGLHVMYLYFLVTPLTMSRINCVQVHADVFSVYKGLLLSTKQADEATFSKMLVSDCDNTRNRNLEDWNFEKFQSYRRENFE
jgi:hypothetical protein